jgi:hypothetical protein
MERAVDAGPPEAAEIVAAECVVRAETEGSPELGTPGRAGQVAQGPKGEAPDSKAHKQVEDEEGEQTRRTSTLITRQGWSRELWINALGMLPVRPAPEEKGR